MTITKHAQRKGWEKILARRGKTGSAQTSRTASKRGVIRKPSKYHAVKTTVDNLVFDSKKEARRYQELKLLEKAGHISQLVCQPSYPLEVLECPSRPIGLYIADFSYIVERETGGPAGTESELVVEDVKGFKTPLYRWKKKHVEAQYGIVIREL